MAYTIKNYCTKRALVDDFKAGEKVYVYQPGPFGDKVPDGKAVIEGPHYPEPHRFYVNVEVKDDVITKVRR